MLPELYATCARVRCALKYWMTSKQLMITIGAVSPPPHLSVIRLLSQVLSVFKQLRGPVGLVEFSPTLSKLHFP